MDVKRTSGAEQRRANKYFYLYEDFVNNVTTPYLSTTGSGTGNAGATVAAFDTTPGVSSYNTGTTTTGRFGVWSNNTTVVYFSTANTWEYETRIYLPVLSDGTETYTVYAGFMDSSSAESADGVYFTYTHGSNSGKFETVTANNGTRTRTDSGITVAATTWYTLKAVVQNVGGTLTARFYINGTQAGSNVTTNIPITAARATGYGLHIVKSAGITATLLYVDYLEVYGKFNSGR